jgi:hypothetical protein
MFAYPETAKRDGQLLKYRDCTKSVVEITTRDSTEGIPFAGGPQVKCCPRGLTAVHLRSAFLAI